MRRRRASARSEGTRWVPLGEDWEDVLAAFEGGKAGQGNQGKEAMSLTISDIALIAIAVGVWLIFLFGVNVS